MDEVGIVFPNVVFVGEKLSGAVYGRHGEDSDRWLGNLEVSLVDEVLCVPVIEVSEGKFRGLTLVSESLLCGSDYGQ